MRRKRRYGEAATVNTVDLKTELVSLRLIINLFPSKRIYNFDETGSFWKSTPNATILFKSLAGGKVTKDRITTMLCYNANGTHKLPN